MKCFKINRGIILVFTYEVTRKSAFRFLWLLFDECVVVSREEQLGPLVQAVTTDGSDSVEGPGAVELAILLLPLVLLSIA